MGEEWKELTELETEVRDAIHDAIESQLYMPELNLAAHRATETATASLREELRDFKLLITGGEDAPGHADTLIFAEAEVLLRRQRREASEEIERLQSQLSEALEALKPFAWHADDFEVGEDGFIHVGGDQVRKAAAVVEKHESKNHD